MFEKELFHLEIQVSGIGLELTSHSYIENQSCFSLSFN